MRDPYRLYRFYEHLRNVHMDYFPDLRFGQLCHNFFGWLADERGVDYFFLEETELLASLDQYAERCNATSKNNKYYLKKHQG